MNEIILLGEIKSQSSLPNEILKKLEMLTANLGPGTKAHELVKTLAAICDLLPQESFSPDLHQKIYYEINLPPLHIDSWVNLPVTDSSVCFIFKSSKFRSIRKDSPYPVKFKDCEIDSTFGSTRSFNCGFYQCQIKTFEFYTDNTIEGGIVLFVDCQIEYLIARRRSLITGIRLVRGSVKALSFPEVSLSVAIFDQVLFKNAPYFIGARLDKTVTFNQCTFVDQDISSLALYRELRHMMDNNYDEVTAAQFAALERKTKHLYLKSLDPPYFSSNWWDLIVSWCYKTINDFGLDVYKPLRLLAGLFVIAIIFFSLLSKFNLLQRASEHSLSTHYLVSASILSALATSGPLRVLAGFKEFYPNLIWGELIFWLFNILSSMLWFFLVLGVRNRYKLS